jgi:excisionase family DNA binding protein
MGTEGDRLPPMLMTERETAEMLGVPYQLLRKWRLRGLAPAHIKVGRTILYEREALEEWIAKRREP